MINSVTKSSSTIPSLRFPGFTEEWEEKSLGKVLKIGNGKSYKHLNTGNIPVFGTGGLMLYVDKALYNGKTVFIGRKGTINKPFYFHGKFWTVDTLFYTYDFSSITAEFTNLVFQQINWLQHNEASGVPSLSKATIEKIKVDLPSLPEQNKIASFIILVESWLDNLRSQKSSLESYKKSIMQKVFSQEIRFMDENGKVYPEWEEKPISEVAIDYDNNRKPISSEKRVKGNYPYYGANGVVDYVDNFIFDGEYVLVAEDGVVDTSKYPIHYVNGKFWVNNHAHVLNGKGISNGFLYYAMQNIKFMKYITGSAQSKLNGKILKKISIKIPNSVEERKITDFLTSIDKHIDFTTRGITNAKKWKKGLMQQMFVKSWQMDKTRQIIVQHKKDFPDFEYYTSILDEIEEHIDNMPDISIEACKSLIEGVSKTILRKLKIAYIEKGRNADTPSSLLRKVLNALSTNSEFELIYTQSSLSLVNRMAEIRNDRGDLSHGRATPKLSSSNSDLAQLVAHVCDGVVFYLLRIVFSTDWSYLNEPMYDENPDFNEILDSENILPGITYSRALFDQDIIFYKEQLKNYNSENSKEKSNE